MIRLSAGLTAGNVSFFSGRVAAFEYGLVDGNKQLVVALGANAIANMRILSHATRNAGPGPMGFMPVVALIVVGCNPFAFFLAVMH